MKKAISLILTALMLCACFAVIASAEEGPVNYARTATYSVESSVGENIYGLKQGDDAPNPGAPRGNDSDHTRLNDGYTGYDECTGLDNVYFKTGSKTDDDKVTVSTEDTSVCYTGTNAEITMIWDLGEVKNDIAKVSFLNCRSDYEWADDNQFEDFVDGIMTNYSRSFPLDTMNLWIAGEDGKYTRLKQKDAWTFEVVGLDNPYTDAVESDLKDCKQRNVTLVFNQSLVCRYIKFGLSPKLYVMSFDEVQIFGGGEPGEMPTQAATTTAAPADSTTAAPADSTTAPATQAPADNTTTATQAPATTVAPATTAAPTTTAAAKTDGGGPSVGLIIGIVAAVIVVAAVVVVVIKKKK